MTTDRRARNQMPQKDKNQFSAFEHLDELRIRLLRAFGAFVIACFICFGLVDKILPTLIRPVGYLTFTTPAESFLAHMTLAIVLGVLFALPVILFEIWAFVASGLRPQERKYVLLYGPLSLLFFIGGCAFAYFVAIPMSLQFFMGFASPTLVPMITVKNYISFVGSLLLTFGLIFELPLILMFLARIGIATPEFLIQKRRYAVIFIFILSAVLTPPDVITMFIMAVPLLILYELGIIAAKLAYKA